MKNKGLILYVELLMFSSITMANSTTTHPVVSWKGAYVGGTLGASLGTPVRTTEPLRISNGTYWFRPFHNSYSYNASPSFIGGGTLGYNWQLGQAPYWVSLEGEYGSLNQSGNSIDPNQIPYSSLPYNNLHPNTSISTTTIGPYYGFVGGRIGYAYEQALFYIKSGAVFTKIESQYHSTKTDTASSTGIAYLNMCKTDHNTGYGMGGGIEYALPFKGFSKVSIKMEYLYLGVGQKVSEYGHCSCDFLWQTREYIPGLHMAKLGLNYRLA